MAGLWFVAFGAIVTARAKRFDIAIFFLIFYVGLLVARMLWLGQPLPVLQKQLSNGALLLFTFFMVTDPMTTPNHRLMRLLYALLVAVGAFAWTYLLFRPNGPVWALFLLSPLVPVLDWLLPATKHRWRP